MVRTPHVDDAFDSRLQLAVYRIADGLARLIAPVLPVTSDQVWQHLPGRREDSVHLALFPEDLAGYRDPAHLATWAKLIEVRDRVNAALEAARKDKLIGNSLGGRVLLRAGGAVGELLESRREDLPMLFIVSDVHLTKGPDDELAIEVTKADGTKCPRCWRMVPVLVTVPDGEICGRCADAVAQTVA